MCDPIFLTVKCVVLDIGFCASKGIIALLEFDVYSSALSKKHKYWPKGVPGDAIYQYFADKYVTYVDILEAITEEGRESKAFSIFCFKELEYVSKIMDTWMILEELDGVYTRQEYNGRDDQSLVRKIKYWQPFGLHFRYCHHVYDHNNGRNAPISI